MVKVEKKRQQVRRRAFIFNEAENHRLQVSFDFVNNISAIV